MIGPQLFLSYNALLEKTEQKNFKKIKLRMAEIPETARTSSCIFIDHLLKFNFFFFSHQFWINTASASVLV